MNIMNFKKELEAVFLITDWSPTESNLHEITRRIKDLRSTASKADVEKIIHDVVGPFERILMEGVDNTDLTTLLLMATKVTNK
ncbi:MAG: hypothetical protein KA288_09425 [Paludibacteraceae bacterium]|nr:hypothetical protein [Paludibacteraceae bacterium]